MAAFDWRTHFAPFIDYLNNSDQKAWAETLTGQLIRRFEDNPHGDMARWQAALEALPKNVSANVELNSSAVTVASDQPLNQQDAEHLELGLRGLMPWRKGPFNFFGTHVDTEWRSDWKWDRVAPHLAELKGRTILDVGCGSGYHCWRMAGAGARQVVGIDPGLLFMFQFLAVKGYLGDVPVDLLPIRMEDLPANLEHFDTTFSMGVLYHRRSP
ncbi:MAG: tRNA 5-methoxyuridine(34)/uridine 5-oxyacetic acid(34) synthase CmoB, partial [Marinobacter sp.]